MYQIEHYPLTGRYYPKCDGKYFYHCSTSGQYEPSDDNFFAVYGDSEEKALKIIDRIKELNDKKNVIIIDVDGDDEVDENEIIEHKKPINTSLIFWSGFFVGFISMVFFVVMKG